MPSDLCERNDTRAHKRYYQRELDYKMHKLLRKYYQAQIKGASKDKCLEVIDDISPDARIQSGAISMLQLKTIELESNALVQKATSADESVSWSSSLKHMMYTSNPTQNLATEACVPNDFKF